MDWLTHKIGCNDCNLVDIEKPATLVKCCLIGAPILRNYLSELAKPDFAKKAKQLKKQFTQELDGKSYKITAKKLKEVMIYK